LFSTRKCIPPPSPLHAFGTTALQALQGVDDASAARPKSLCRRTATRDRLHRLSGGGAAFAACVRRGHGQF
jgi:hypothetical protein